MRTFELQAAGGPFHDPALLVSPKNLRHSILFDCGTLHSLKTRDLLRVRWLFLSHLHIDHVIGFDHLLRVRLFSEQPLHIFGPPGTAQAIGHRLQGYAWNLTSGSPFVIQAHDLGDSDVVDTVVFRCHHRFQPEEPQETPCSTAGEGKLELSSGLSVQWHSVEHGVPCYCYRLERHFPPTFSPKTCRSLGLIPGPWVRNLTEGRELSMEVQGQERNQEWLRRELLTYSEPDTLGFLTDTRLTLDLTSKLKLFFSRVQMLVCECAYLTEDAKLAEQNLHMTTGQVAELATKSEAEHLRLFHLSRRYQEFGPARHLAEVKELFPSAGLL